jgi:delta8-fatty-acid desaturase
MTTTSTTFSKADVEKHNKEDDLWLIIGQKVYDISKFANYHPGTLLPLIVCAGVVLSRFSV